MTLKIFIERDPLYLEKVRYTWGMFARFLGLSFSEVTSQEQSDLSIGTDDKYTWQVSRLFYERIRDGIFDHALHLDASGRVLCPNGNTDWLSLVFYLINSLQEYNAPYQDDVGRFPYAHSCQYRFGSSDQNAIVDCFYALYQSHGLFAKITPFPRRSSCVLLSHDIDLVYGAVWDDGRVALRRGRVDLAMKLVFNAVLQRPDWINMDKIMQTETEFGLRSVFFWLANRGKINAREVNADYSILHPRIRREMAEVNRRGFENGIHKSIGRESLSAEMDKFPHKPMANRQHYLKFRIPDLYHQCDEAGIAVDCSLGFAEQPGFRNSCGLPFRPFDLTADRAYRVTEVPLHMMDFTYFKYKGLTANAAQQEIIDFFEKHRHNALLSLLWHNTFFSSVQYRDYPGVYTALLAWLHEQRFEALLPSQIPGHPLCLSDK